MEANNKCEDRNGLDIHKIENLKAHGSDRSLGRTSRGVGRITWLLLFCHCHNCPLQNSLSFLAHGAYIGMGKRWPLGDTRFLH